MSTTVSENRTTAVQEEPWPSVPLTIRERVVLSELASADSLQEIATRLFVTRNTVKSQVRAVYRKIGVCTREDAVAWALAHGIRRPR